MMNKNLKILIMLLMSILPMQLSAVTAEDNTAPIALDDNVTGEKNKEIIFTLADLVGANDTDPDGDTLTLLNVFDPINGTATLNEDGTVTFIPDENFTGEASFNYTVVDRVIIDTDIPVPVITFIDYLTAEAVIYEVLENLSPEINGTCEPGYTVTVQVSGTAIEPTQVCDASGKFSIVPSTPLAITAGTRFPSVFTATELSPFNRVSELSNQVQISLAEPSGPNP